jgi:hypothetical protein
VTNAGDQQIEFRGDSDPEVESARRAWNTSCAMRLGMRLLSDEPYDFSRTNAIDQLAGAAVSELIRGGSVLSERLAKVEDPFRRELYSDVADLRALQHFFGQNAAGRRLLAVIGYPYYGEVTEVTFRPHRHMTQHDPNLERSWQNFVALAVGLRAVNGLSYRAGSQRWHDVHDVMTEAAVAELMAGEESLVQYLGRWPSEAKLVVDVAGEDSVLAAKILARPGGEDLLAAASESAERIGPRLE